MVKSKDPSDLKPAVLISRVMSGKAEYRTSDYLSAFGALPMSDLRSPNDFVSNSDVIKLWNMQQSCPSKVRYVTFSIVHNNGFLQKRIASLYPHAKYAWIKHDQDQSEHSHYHYVLIFPNPISFRGIANDLELPLPMVEKVISKRGILDYLTHENQPEKHHYPLSAIEANFDIQEEKQLDESIDPKQLFRHFCQVRNGEMTPETFLDIYAVYCKNLAFPSLLQVCSRLFEGFGTGMGLSSRSECRVPNPCESPPYSLSQTPYGSRKLHLLRHSTPNEPIPVLDLKDGRQSTPWLINGHKVCFDIPPPPKKSKRKSSHKPNPRSDLNDIN